MKHLIALFIIISLFACQTNSNKKKETKATVLAAAEASGLQKSIQKSLFAEIDKFVESTETNSKKINVTVLKGMSMKDAKKTGNAHVKEIVDNQDAGKKEIVFIPKKEFKETSIMLIKNRKDPLYKYIFKFSLSGFKKFNFFITFL